MTSDQPKIHVQNQLTASRELWPQIVAAVFLLIALLVVILAPFNAGSWMSRVPSNNYVDRFYLPYVIAIIHLAAAIWVFVARRKEAGARAFAMVSAAMAVLMAAAFDSYTTKSLILVWAYSLPMVGAGLFDLAMMYPDTDSLVIRFPAFRYVGYAGGLAIFAYILLRNFLYPLGCCHHLAVRGLLFYFDRLFCFYLDRFPAYARCSNFRERTVTPHFIRWSGCFWPYAALAGRDHLLLPFVINSDHLSHYLGLYDFKLSSGSNQYGFQPGVHVWNFGYPGLNRLCFTGGWLQPDCGRTFPPGKSFDRWVAVFLAGSGVSSAAPMDGKSIKIYLFPRRPGL